MKCKHKCNKTCHNLPCEWFCDEKCIKPLNKCHKQNNIHKCDKLCKQCNHKNDHICTYPINKQLKCGHSINTTCDKYDIIKCNKIISFKCKNCNNSKQIECDKLDEENNKDCLFNIELKLNCGH